MRATGHALVAVMVAGLCGACGGSGHDGSDSGADGGSDASGGSDADGGWTNGGKSSTGGTSAGGSAAGGTASTGPGTVTDVWSDFCVATFTEDYPVTDVFGDPVFTAQTGEAYLLIDYPSPYTSASAAYLTSTGPLDFDIEPNADLTSFPFTSNCSPNPPLSYFAVFADVSVYAEPELVTDICALEAGAALPRDTGVSAGYALSSFVNGSAVYEIFLNAFSAQCGGAESGYVSVPTIHLFDSDRVLVPFDVIVAEN
jgi:hypothetical protein